MTSITDVIRKVEEVMEEKDFSGVVLLQQNGKTLFSQARGYANRSEQISNTSGTRFGIASGCKVFTAVSIGQLIEQGKFSYESRLVDVLNIEFPLWDKEITVHQLLTHTAGIPDYFDEEVMEDFAELWQERPVYMMQQLHDFLPMFQNLAMKSTPGERFHYNNAGYIVLGLIVEQQSGQSFTEYVKANIFKASGMKDSGYFRTDQLPSNTAIGYVDQEDGTWNTNIFSIPVQGGSDGGAYVTAQDMIHFWNALLGYMLLTEESTRKLLIPYSHQEDKEYYGRGIWIDQKGEEIFKYHVMGFDPGVSFMSSVYPAKGIQLVVLSNQEWGPYPVTVAIEESLLV